VFTTDDPDGIYAVLDDGSGSPVELSAGLALVGNPDVSGNRVLLRGQASGDVLDQLYARNIDGTGLVRLSNLNNPDARVFSASFSLDGSSVMFIADGETVGVYELYLAKIGGIEPQRINDALNANESVGRYYWSPNGIHVAYTINTSGATAKAIEIYDTDNQSWFRVDFPEPVDDLAWSPTGDKLAFIRKDRDGLKPAYQMYTIGVDGSGPTKSNGNLSAIHFLESYAWSPNGQYLAQMFRLRDEFDTNQHAKAFVNLYDVSIPDSIRVVEFPITPDNRNRGNCFLRCGFTWSHQGTELAYLSNHVSYEFRQTDEIELFSYNVDDRLDPQVQDGFPGDKTIRQVLGTTSDDRFLVYRGGAVSNTGDLELVEYADLVTSAPATRISEDGNEIRSYAWSGDHERFFDIRVTGGEHIIEVREEDDFTDAREILAPRWSPHDRFLQEINLSRDGKNLVYRAAGFRAAVSSQLRSTPVSGGPARLISGTLDVGGVIGY
jgi:Tol biopolymer transport system component